MKRMILFALLLAAFGTSCKTVKIGMEMLLVDLDGRTLIDNEEQVKNYLEIILLAPDEYTMTAYTRRAFSPELERTKNIYHSFYVVASKELPFFFTLSFTGTKKWPYSQGVWAINIGSDMKSYFCYLFSENEWELQEIITDKGINTGMTIRNVTSKIDGHLTYYFNDHKHDKAGKENCNTALENTLVENI